MKRYPDELIEAVLEENRQRFDLQERLKAVNTETVAARYGLSRESVRRMYHGRSVPVAVAPEFRSQINNAGVEFWRIKEALRDLTFARIAERHGLGHPETVRRLTLRYEDPMAECVMLP